jgi:RNA polymerase sigma factor (sigma-70 family)
MTLDFESAYTRHLQRIYGFFAYRVGSREDAEELTQRTFERALNAWARFDPERGSLGVWLSSIARNLLIDHYRADSAAQQQPLDEAGEEGLGSVAPEPSLGIDPEVAAALAQLSVRDREVIALRYGGELTGPEIAELTGLSLANVQQIISRSLRRLRLALEAAPGQ